MRLHDQVLMTLVNNIVGVTRLRHHIYQIIFLEFIEFPFTEYI